MTDDEAADALDALKLAAVTLRRYNYGETALRLDNLAAIIRVDTEQPTPQTPGDPTPQWAIDLRAKHYPLGEPHPWRPNLGW